jgi:hypothetical protein
MTQSQLIDAPNDAEAIFELFDSQGMLDGNPIIEPTVERVSRFNKYVEERLERDPSQVLGLMAPAMGETTIEKVAVNAVMAGCKKEYMSMLIPAAELLIEHGNTMMVDFGSHTQHIWLVVNGPIRTALDIQSGEHGSTGASWRANTTIMRALRLLAINCGGSPGVSGKRSFGYVGAYAAALAENEEASPWEPYHIERGYTDGDSTVTLMNVEPPKHIEFGRWAYTPAELLAGFADSMSNVANRYAYGEYDVVVILGKDHANTLAAAGFSKADVKRFLFDHARTPYGKFGANARDGFLDEWKKFYTHSPDALVPMVDNPDQFHVFVCGGPGPNSLFTGMQRGGMPIARVLKPSNENAE